MKTSTQTMLAASSLLLSACQLNTPNLTAGIDHRTERFDDIITQKTFMDCKQEGHAFDRQASEQNRQELYLASAEKLLSCESNLGQNAHLIDVQDRMKTYALGIQNKVKGGDVNGASVAFQKFKSYFAGMDLIYENGSSFSASYTALLGANGDADQLKLASINAKPQVKKEVRRIWHWRTK